MSNIVIPFQILIAMSFVATVATAIVWDARSFRIPNEISIILVALFVPAALAAPAPINWIGHIGIALAVFAAGVALFHFGLFGGGDVKLLSALSLWMGLSLTPVFLILVGLLGGLVALLLLTLRWALRPLNASLAERGQSLPRVLLPNESVPYGIAIGIAALMVTPRLPLFFPA